MEALTNAGGCKARIRGKGRERGSAAVATWKALRPLLLMMDDGCDLGVSRSVLYSMEDACSLIQIQLLCCLGAAWHCRIEWHSVQSLPCLRGV